MESQPPHGTTTQTHPRLHRRRRVVLVVFPYQGHINPILQLGTILHSKYSFPITIAHPNFNPLNPSTHHEFHFLPFGDSSFDGNTVDLGRIGEFMVRFNEEEKEGFREAMEGLMKEEEGIGCIVYDQYMYLAQQVVDELGLIGIALRTSSAASLLSFASNSMADGGRFSADELGIQYVARAVQGMKAFSNASLTQVRTAASNALAKSTAILVNTTESLESHFLRKGQLLFKAPIFPIGPFHKMITQTNLSNSLLQEESSCISWLDKFPPRSVLYVSYGSIASITESEFIEMAWGLEASKVPFLWVIRSTFVKGERPWDEVLPISYKEMVRERSRVVSWSPQIRVLKHEAVGGFWSHCGWNSTLESVCEGVPMICRPFFGDQSINTKYVTKVWKVGLELESKDLEKGKIAECVRRLMLEKDGDEMRERAVVLKEKVTAALEGGSSEKYLDQLVDLISQA